MGKLMEVFTRFGFPEQLITDNASYFTAKVFVDSCAALGIKHRKTTTYHAQSNPTERVNRNVKHMLVAFAEEHRDWDAHISELGFALRTTVNRSTGYAPASLNLGRELLNPMDRILTDRSGAPVVSSAPAEYATKLRARLTEALLNARHNLSTARAQQKAQYDRSHRDVRYEVGDLVLRRNHVLSDASKQFAASLAKKVGRAIPSSRKGFLPCVQARGHEGETDRWARTCVRPQALLSARKRVGGECAPPPTASSAPKRGPTNEPGRALRLAQQAETLTVLARVHALLNVFCARACEYFAHKAVFMCT